MAFAVEVPGEAAPLTAELLSKALISATSSQQLSIQTGTQQLKAWECQKGYFSLLQSAYFDKSLPSEVRHLAIIQLKNGTDKYWRRTATNAIAAEEKAQVRSRLLEGVILEEEKNLALQNALLVSKVVRIDYPNEWPEVLPSLIKMLRDSRYSENHLHLQRGMLILIQIVKELATARLRTSQAKVVSITLELVILLTEIYLENVSFWYSSLTGQIQSDEGKILDAMQSSLLTIMILRRLMVIGYEHPNHSVDVQRLWGHSQTQFGQLLEIISHRPQFVVPSIKNRAEDHLLQLSKLHLDMAKKHPAAFALLPTSLDLVRAYWGLVSQYGDSCDSEKYDLSLDESRADVSAKSGDQVMERLCLKGLGIMRKCIQMVFSPSQTFKYKNSQTKAEEKEAIEQIKTKLLNDSLIQQIANVIVTKFFVLRQSDIEAWAEGQEEWELREEGSGDTWEFELRPCSERLFTDVVINYKHLLIGPLLSYFGSVSRVGQATVITKDAVYTAIGLSSVVVFGSFDFDSFLASTLVHDVQQTGPGFNILRRRIAILLGQWLSIKISEENKLIVYQIFQHLLNPEDETNDRVVRITAARQFKQIIDDFNFAVEKFVPYASGILGRVMNLIHEVESTETKIVILNTICSIAYRMGKDIAPYADQIVSLLASLWETAGEEYLLKQTVFSILSTIVSSLQSASDRYYPFIIPLIASSTTLNSQNNAYLYEDALDLWVHVIETTPSVASPSILSLFDSINPLLDMGTDEIYNVLQILDGYCILAPQHVLSETHRIRILSSLTSFLGITKRGIAGLVTSIVENLIRAAETLGGAQGVALIVQDLHKSGFLTQIFAALRDAWEAHQTVGTEKRYPKLDDVVETDYFTIISRLAVADPNLFANVLSSWGSFDEVWSWLSTEWFRHFDSMPNIERQKLSCLALTRMLELPHPMLNSVLAKLQDYFSIWTQAIGVINDDSEDFFDSLIWKPSDVGTEENTDMTRRREWATADIVHKISLWEFVKEKLANVIEVSGGNAKFMEEWLVNVDEDVLKSYRALGMNNQQN